MLGGMTGSPSGRGCAHTGCKGKSRGELFREPQGFVSPTSVALDPGGCRARGFGTLPPKTKAGTGFMPCCTYKGDVLT